ncbi:UNVERIFIED_CONTAM: Lactosylceramide 4-alpha-galactosyltransferase [Sesamum latifolium]|uniref:Lactosylceramide 4-alpha-galactosyltransferase n=1 Tax=Sesamum latifolium TaxID=2727402 RepID=A0AAW2TS98_9LAMI
MQTGIKQCHYILYTRPNFSRSSAGPSSFSPENVPGNSRKFFSVNSSARLSSAALFSVKGESSSAKLKTHLPLLHKNRNLVVRTTVYHSKRRRDRSAKVKQFEDRVMEFFNPNSSDSSWLKVTAISPDFNYLFKNTPAQAWYNQLILGNVNPGEVPLGQNLSNLLRLGLLYRFGGIYLDTDIIVLKTFRGLKNAIGAQTIDLDTGKWSRLNNAVMIFDEGHPLLYKFIQEFALTFDGNKWGHNGPYLVSRVVSRVTRRPGYNFTVLPPMAFYPVDWSKIGSLFQGPQSLNHSKWLLAKLRQIRSLSFAVHLWNKQSRGFEVQKGSIIQHIMFSSGAFYNSSTVSTE